MGLVIEINLHLQMMTVIVIVIVTVIVKPNLKLQFSQLIFFLTYISSVSFGYVSVSIISGVTQSIE